MSAQLDLDEVVLLERSLRDGLVVTVTVEACQFACCGKGFRSRAGYEQTYTGRIAHIELDSDMEPSYIRMNGLGIGSVGFVMIADTDDVCLVKTRG